MEVLLFGLRGLLFGFIVGWATELEGTSDSWLTLDID